MESGRKRQKRKHYRQTNPSRSQESFFFLTEVGNQQFLPYNDHIYLQILFIDEPKNKNIEM